MIEVNLHPNAPRKGDGGISLAGIGRAFSNLRSGGPTNLGIDPYQAFFAVAASVALGFMGFSYWSIGRAREELDLEVEAAVQDSLDNAAIIDQTNALAERAMQIENRVQLIQQLDEGRYDWPHILDEVARNVPDFTWLTQVLAVSEDPIMFSVSGRAGSIFAITQFMQRLEASRFIRGVDLQSTQEIQSEGDAADRVYEFELQMTYSAPPLDELETVPLFDDATAQAQGANPGN